MVSVLSEDEAEDYRQYAGAPAIVGEPAELALFGNELHERYGRDAGEHGGEHAEEICRDKRSVDALLSYRLDEAEQVGAQHRGQAHKEGVLHRKIPVKARCDTCGDGGSGAGQSGDGGHALAQSDGERVAEAHVLLRALARCHFIRNEQHAARQQQRDADEGGYVVELLHLVVYGQHEKERQRADDYHHEKPRGAEIALHGSTVRTTSAAQHDEHLSHHGYDVAPVADADGDERAEVQQHIEKQVIFARGEGKQILQYGKVARARYGQKLRYALHDTQ